MKKFLIKTSLSITIILVIVVSVNSLSLHKFTSGNVEHKMVKNILSGKYVTNLAKYNDRLFQKLIVEQMDSLPREIVLGSSRSMQITHEFATITPFYNSSAYGGQLNDILAIYNIYEERNAPIQRVIINVDSWIFRGDHYAYLESQPIYDQYCNMCKKLAIEPRYKNVWINKLDLLFSIRNFTDNVRSLRKPMGIYASGAVLFEPTSDSLGFGETEYTDGSYSVYEAERNQTREQLANVDVASGLSTNFKEFDQGQVKEFEKFVLYLKNRDVDVVLLFAPFHPSLYDAGLTKDRTSLETENYVKKFAKENQIETLGSFNPHLYNLDVIDFINLSHPKKEAFYPIFGKQR